MADEQVNAGGVETAAPSTGGAKATATTPQPVTQPQGVVPTVPSTGSGTEKQTETNTDFRKWQAERDRERARLQADADKARKQLADERQASRMREIAGLDPEDRAAELAKELQAERASKAQADADQQQQAMYSQRAMSALAKAGIKPDDQRLAQYITGETWPERMANLTEGIVSILGEEREKLQAEVAKAEKRGGQQALEASGVLQVSGATSTPTDGASGKEAEYRAKLKALKGSGKLSAIVLLKSQAEKDGISL